MKPKQIRIRITDGDAALLDALAGQVLSTTDVASLMLHGALEAVSKNNGRVQFPPKFKVEEEASAAGKGRR